MPLEKERVGEILRILPVTVREYISRLQLSFMKLQEIRLRISEPILLLYDGKEWMLGKKGGLTEEKKEAYCISEKEVGQTLEYVSNYSLYAFEDEIRQGFITIQGGHRIGMAGKIIMEGGKIKGMKNISFLNIRLAHQVFGCAKRVLPYVMEKGRVLHTLIISPPRCGKTTLLRDLIRELSEGSVSRKGVTVGVVDERSELGACYKGQPQNELGVRTDVLDCCPKKEGMLLLVRSMAPDVVAVDEIGGMEDIQAISYVIHCGISILATLHGEGMEDVFGKPGLQRLVQDKMFQRYIVLDGKQVGKVKEIFDARGTVLMEHI